MTIAAITNTASAATIAKRTVIALIELMAKIAQPPTN
jgi:hypothetical protein